MWIICIYIIPYIYIYTYKIYIYIYTYKSKAISKSTLGGPQSKSTAWALAFTGKCWPKGPNAMGAVQLRMANSPIWELLSGICCDRKPLYIYIYIYIHMYIYTHMFLGFPWCWSKNSQEAIVSSAKASKNSGTGAPRFQPPSEVVGTCQARKPGCVHLENDKPLGFRGFNQSKQAAPTANDAPTRYCRFISKDLHGLRSHFKNS